ncbi:MAG TPA: hypothetical protein VHX49_01265 [Candidatus Acidoferrales bacterium]|nr:hypothetical protein [Candidatus Acidoferrales bacterium]
MQIKSKEEILRTLDGKGQLDGMPFMPEMFAFCGKRFQIRARAHKTCDTVFPIRGRSLSDSIHIDTRCDGSAHGECQATCLIFWKTAWIHSATDEKEGTPSEAVASTEVGRTACSEDDVWTQASNRENGEIVYTCQATRLPYATNDLSWWDVRQYIEDYTSGNVGLWRIFCSFIYSLYYSLSQAGVGLGRPMRWFYDKAHVLWGGSLFPMKFGTIPKSQPTPAEELNLQPRELVRVKSHEEILRTLNTEGKNRGMSWDSELVPYCGGTYRVLRRISKIINEQTGKMQEIKNPCVILDSVVCQARYSACRLFCPRAIYSWWREVWLERVESETSRSETKRKPEHTAILTRS